MPVAIDSAAGGAGIILGSSTTGNATATHIVSANATDLVAVAAVMFVTGADQSGASFTCSFGGVSMTPYATVDWNSHKHVLKLFTLDAPTSGSHTVTGAFTSAATETPVRNLVIASATYSGVDSIGDAVTVSGGDSSTTTHNAVTVSSVAEAHRVVTVHGVGGLELFTAFDKVTRVHAHSFGPGGGDLLLGDAPGAATVTATATQLLTTQFWGAIGIPMLPSTVNIDAALSLSMDMGSSASIFRSGTPDPHRYWLIDV